MDDKFGIQVGHKCKLMWPKAHRVGDKSERQVGKKLETSANSCGPRHPEWDTGVGNRCGKKVMRPKTTRVGVRKCTEHCFEPQGLESSQLKHQ